jgi:hypothetical protein
VKHQARRPTTWSLTDTVEGRDEGDAREAIRRAYREPRIIVSVERLD